MSNIRRFGEDVSLDFGIGATILLAPNGTGKSTIFQAVELALTEKLRMLEDEKDALGVRDVLVRRIEGKIEAQANIELLFSDAQVAHAQFANGVWNFPSIPQNLFGRVGKDSVPYALKLTHFLDQADGKWIVHESSDKAGKQTSNLSLAKDANKALAARRSVLTQGKKRVAEAKRILVEAQAKLKEWDQLKKELLATQPSSGDPLISIDAANQSLDVICAGLGIENFPIANDIPTLLANAATANATYSQRLNAFKEQSFALAGAEPMVEQFQALKAQLLNLGSDLKKVLEAKQELDDAIKVHHKTKEELVQEKENARKQSAELNRKLGLLGELDQKKVEETELRRQIDMLEKRLPRLEEELKVANKALADAKEVEKQYLDFERRARELERKKATISDLEVKIVGWEKELQLIEEDEGNILRMMKAVAASGKTKLDETQKELAAAKLKRETTDREIDELAKIAGAISEAVKNIEKNLPKDASVCPVCNFDHKDKTPNLHDEILAAIEKADPRQGVLQNRLQQERSDEEGLLKLESKLRVEHQKGLELIKELEESLAGRKRTVFSELKLSANGLETITEVKASLSDLISELKALEDDLSAKRQGAPSRPTTLELSDLESAVARIIKSLEDSRLEKKQHETKLEQNLGWQKAALDDLGEVRATATLIASIQELTNLIAARETSIGDLKAKIEAVETEQQMKTKEISRTNNEISDLRATESELISRWKAMNLEGEPNEAARKKAMDLKDVEIQQLEMNQPLQDALDSQLQRLSASLTYLAHLEKQKDMVGDQTVDSFEENLATEISNLKGSHEDLEKKYVTLTTFLEELKGRAEDAELFSGKFQLSRHAIMKRILVDERFNDMVFQESLEYNRPHTRTKMSYSDKEYAIKHLASEAQLTDIQLSMVLANAKGMPWSPWRGLLLDDPTQHHDLIHAAGVFDVLRDFIVDHGFQIMMGTHDSVHANFFKRKLQNDGVPVKVYLLVPTENGVVARLQD